MSEKSASKDDNFEKNLSELEGIVDELEGGSLDLEESLKKFEKGVKLYKNCQGKLGQVEKKIKKLTESLKEEELDYIPED